MVTLDDVREAQARVAPLIRRTPTLPAANLTTATGVELLLKLETMQVTGAFKERGAANCLLQLDDEARARGVFAASAGNHAQGLAIGAKRLGLRATIVMGRFTPRIKVARTRRHGAEVVLFGDDYEAAAAHARELCDRAAGTFVHPFDDDAVIAGQGGIGLELLEDVADLDAVVVPIGGGGLISGVAVAIKGVAPHVKVYGVQSASFAAMARSFASGQLEEVAGARTIAEGIAVRRAHARTFEHIRRYVDDVVSVSEEEIAKAIVMLLEEERVVAEGAGAAPLAAILSGKLPDLTGKRVALLVSGGNIDINLVSSIIERGLVRAARRVRFNMIVPDRPGVLADFSRIVADHGANVMELRHERAFSRTAVGDAEVELFLEVAGPDDIAELRKKLEARGYVIL
ncbi:MAG: threonine ammonia-lyase [Myxococcales bacterium]|nr:threonine ammonia-lyase [Myxococcales bacterium]MCB9531570.1 threonine ammonia-lyase [Myxococcales bacterium]MCB9532779.1 threonine ammonia-lyase [Myxococcales bacterium]